MIERLIVKNFKSLKNVGLKLGRLNLFIGANASGKSNILDALRVLQLVAGGFPIKELFEGGVQTTAGGNWLGLRGGLANAIFKPRGLAVPPPETEAIIEVETATELGKMGFRIGFDSTGRTTRESLTKEGKEIFDFDGGDAWFKDADGGLIPSYPSRWAGSQIVHALTLRLAGPQDEAIIAMLKTLQSMRFLDLDPDILRGYGAAADVRVIGEHGENFASVVRNICVHPKSKAAYLAWLRELRPHEVDDVMTLTGAVGEALFALQEAGRDFPAPALSDGTLRFAALAAFFFQDSMPKLVTIEEIENGIHGSRLRLLLELLRSQSAAVNTQVIATTHSPLLLEWLKPEEFETTFLCKRDDQTGESLIVPLAQVSNFNATIGKHSLAELFMEGWMEEAV